VTIIKKIKAQEYLICISALFKNKFIAKTEAMPSVSGATCTKSKTVFAFLISENIFMAVFLFSITFLST